jgi:hypothetical protein
MHAVGAPCCVTSKKIGRGVTQKRDSSLELTQSTVFCPGHQPFRLYWRYFLRGLYTRGRQPVRCAPHSVGRVCCSTTSNTSDAGSGSACHVYHCRAAELTVYLRPLTTPELCRIAFWRTTFACHLYHCRSADLTGYLHPLAILRKVLGPELWRICFETMKFAGQVCQMDACCETELHFWIAV